MSSLSMLASLPVYLQGFEPYIFVFPKIEEIKRSPNQEYTHNKCNLFDVILEKKTTYSSTVVNHFNLFDLHILRMSP